MSDQRSSTAQPSNKEDDVRNETALPLDSPFDRIREDAWAIEQGVNRDEYLGHTPDVDEVARNVGRLAFVVIELCDLLDQYRVAVENA